MDEVVQRRLLPLLPLVVAVGDTGQVTAAADVLGLPQPTVSRGLARLGDVLGAPIVEKHGRGIRMTPAGEALLPHARAALAAAAAGADAVRERDSQAYGTLSIAFQNTLGDRVVPNLIRAFLADHPRTKFELTQGSRGSCLDALDSGAAEIALIAPIEHRPELVAVSLHTEPLVLLVPAGHRFSSAARVDLAEAAHERFISLKPGFGLHSLLYELAGESGFEPRVAFEGDDLHTVRGLVAAGLGVALVPQDRAAAGSGGVEVAIARPVAQREVGAVWPDSRPTSLAAAMQRLLRRRGPALTAAGLR
ncbi:LysR family transcriptional regulator [Microlunatus elymi]|uniref:LysR family transcriptional regulator n=1 Tax=Microlunatus elymi TaxID=2596828 RepID=UPI001D18B54F|nr:LysR family transcriptional regulator [Microlunatus elymi]